MNIVSRVLQLLYAFQGHKQEKTRCNMLFERESRREKILEARQRELKLKERERSGKARVDDDAPKRKNSTFPKNSFMLVT